MATLKDLIQEAQELVEGKQRSFQDHDPEKVGGHIAKKVLNDPKAMENLRVARQIGSNTGDTAEDHVHPHYKQWVKDQPHKEDPAHGEKIFRKAVHKVLDKLHDPKDERLPDDHPELKKHREDSDKKARYWSYHHNPYHR